MKRIFAALLCVLFIVTACVSFSACENTEQKDSLVVYNWADYIYDYEDDFKEYYKSITGKNIDITYVTFDTNETMLTKITKGDTNVDVICPSEYAIQKLLESDMLMELDYFDEEKFTAGISLSNYEHNSENVDKNIVSKIEESFGEIRVSGKDKTASMTDYFVPYMYGTLGILYNKYEFNKLGLYDKEKMNSANWGILFNDDGNGNLFSERLSGSILMKDSIRDSYVATLFYLSESKTSEGKSRLDGLTYQDKNSPYYGTPYTDMPISALINAVDDQLIDLCEEVLTNQKQHLFGYEVDFGKDDLLKGNAMVDLAWSGDALYAVEESWNDCLCFECGGETGKLIDGEIVCANNPEHECGDYELAYYVPHTAGNIWFDGWVVPKTYNPEHMDAIKLFINFLNTPYVAAQNMLEIGYSSAVSPDVVKSDDGARAVLAESYIVYDPDYWTAKDDDGNELSQDKCDYASWEEFSDYFFNNYNEIDSSNWRYPFEVAESDGGYKRDLTTLGVMRDFGANNSKVVTMWNYARSAGVSALPLLLWTALALAVIVAVVAVALLIKRRKEKYVVIKENR